MNRLLNTSSITGSTFVPTASCLAIAVTRRRMRLPPLTHSASQSVSRILVPVGSVRIAGPLTVSPSCIVVRSITGISCHAPCDHIFPVLAGAAGAVVSGKLTVSPVTPMASAVSTSISNVAFSGTKPNRCICAASNASVISAIGANGTSRVCCAPSGRICAIVTVVI